MTHYALELVKGRQILNILVRTTAFIASVVTILNTVAFLFSRNTLSANAHKFALLALVKIAAIGFILKSK
jgi:hypothetical protein